MAVTAARAVHMPRWRSSLLTFSMAAIVAPPHCRRRSHGLAELSASQPCGLSVMRLQ